MGRFPRLLTILGNHHCQSLAECQEARLRLVTDCDEAHYFFCSVTIPPTADSFDYESAILIRLNVAIDLVPYSSLGSLIWRFHFYDKPTIQPAIASREPNNISHAIYNCSAGKL